MKNYYFQSFEKFRSFEHSLSETELATVCQKVLPNRTEPNFRSITNCIKYPK